MAHFLVIIVMKTRLNDREKQRDKLIFFESCEEYAMECYYYVTIEGVFCYAVPALI
jgi:hypothetical protein